MTKEEVTSSEGVAYAEALFERGIAEAAMRQYWETGFGDWEAIATKLTAAREEVNRTRAVLRKSLGYSE